MMRARAFLCCAVIGLDRIGSFFSSEEPSGTCRPHTDDSNCADLFAEASRRGLRGSGVQRPRVNPRNFLTEGFSFRRKGNS